MSLCLSFRVPRKPNRSPIPDKTESEKTALKRKNTKWNAQRQREINQYLYGNPYGPVRGGDNYSSTARRGESDRKTRKKN